MTITFNDPAAFVLSITYALVALFGSYHVTRYLGSFKKSSGSAEDKMGATAGFFSILVLAAVCAIVTLVMLFTGGAGIPALVTCALVGVAFGVGSRS